MNDAPRPRRSVFLKLLLVFVLAGAANVAVMHVFYRHIVYDDARRMHRSQNMAEYADYLASFGADVIAVDPPDLREAVIRRLKGVPQ